MLHSGIIHKHDDRQDDTLLIHGEQFDDKKPLNVEYVYVGRLTSSSVIQADTLNDTDLATVWWNTNRVWFPWMPTHMCSLQSSEMLYGSFCEPTISTKVYLVWKPFSCLVVPSISEKRSTIHSGKLRFFFIAPVEDLSCWLQLLVFCTYQPL